MDARSSRLPIYFGSVYQFPSSNSYHKGLYYVRVVQTDEPNIHSLLGGLLELPKGVQVSMKYVHRPGSEGTRTTLRRMYMPVHGDFGEFGAPKDRINRRILRSDSKAQRKGGFQKPCGLPYAYPRGSKYEDSGSILHTLNGFWDQNP